MIESTSVIIPTFNRAHVLDRAIQSVAGQRLPPLEVIIVDDGSFDHTADVVRDWSQRLNVRLLSQPNRGVSAARNLGIQQAKGEWIAFLDSDDEWLPNRLQEQYELWITQPDLLIIHGEEIWIRRGVRVNSMKKHKKGGGRIYLDCLPLCCISPSAVIIHEKVFKKVGLFNEEYPVCEDYDLWLRISSLYPIGFVSTPIIRKYGGHKDQLSDQYFAMDYWRVRSLERALRDFSWLNESEREATRSILQKKMDILIKGFRKHHPNFVGVNENPEIIPLLKKNNGEALSD